MPAARHPRHPGNIERHSGIPDGTGRRPKQPLGGKCCAAIPEAAGQNFVVCFGIPNQSKNKRGDDPIDPFRACLQEFGLSSMGVFVFNIYLLGSECSWLTILGITYHRFKEYI